MTTGRLLSLNVWLHVAYCLLMYDDYRSLIVSWCMMSTGRSLSLDVWWLQVTHCLLKYGDYRSLIVSWCMMTTGRSLSLDVWWLQVAYCLLMYDDYRSLILSWNTVSGQCRLFVAREAPCVVIIQFRWRRKTENAQTSRHTGNLLHQLFMLN